MIASGATCMLLHGQLKTITELNCCLMQQFFTLRNTSCTRCESTNSMLILPHWIWSRSTFAHNRFRQVTQADRETNITHSIDLNWIHNFEKKILILLGEFETARPLRFFPTDFRNPGWGFRRTHDGRGRTTVASARLWTPLNFFKNNRSQTKIVNEMQREILLATLAQRTTKR
jgi:hypothetical protein